ncbi:SPFH domain-containing protein [Dolichospermum circinale]|uniref:SPFH domain-containing protein n=2 Tax=Dolichospermum circinale TaxID=109265 RepID=UPI00232F0363|nr:SPFH domain-containing protein [Dolichospermum circinale]MDB9456202.1 SPFH domain-containing protein [Dolichospermum circinale CS-541/06]MDB9462620.1 SPFH domain-containing protein [Dolichospermum circinale CS-541/04]MDB9546209.1 SPFH domain-containing protein [Dolichospermum circinale CS-1031]
MFFIDIKEDEVGIMYKRFGRPLPMGGRVAVNGEIGLQADILPPGLHLNLPNVEIRIVKAIVIAADEVGLVDARDGASLPPGQNFGKAVECNDFQDAKAFIKNGGQKGKQRAILTTGTYRINTGLFSVEIVNVIRIRKDEVGLVESREGKPLPPGQAFGKVVECNNFQNAQAFADNGGQSGKQLAILTSNTYQINTNIFKIKIVNCVRIGEDKIGLVRATSGKPLPTNRTFGKVIECNNFQDAQAFYDKGESGKQLAFLTPATYQINTDLFKVKIDSVTKVPQGEIGLVVANDGLIRPEDRNLSKIVECHNFENAQAFIENGGESGKQLAILSARTYQINTDLFTVITSANAEKYNVKPEELKIYTVGKDKIGIVTTLEGKTLPEEEIAGAIIKDHDNFQKPQKFIEAGGYKGLQQEFLQEGSWTLNPWFVRVEQVPLISILAEQVGVIISYVGKTVDDKSKNDSRLVEEGYKGIQRKPLPPGKYPINTRIKSVHVVPTNEIILNWSKSEGKPEENYDKILEPLQLRSKDGFVFQLELTQTICIAENDAPKMILKIGAQPVDSLKPNDSNLLDSNSQQVVKSPAIKNLVTKVLGPLVDSHFQVSAQGYDALDFFDKRGEIQRNAADYITDALNSYGVQSIQTLMTNIDLPDELEALLRERQIQQQKAENYKQEELTEKARQSLIKQQEINKAEAELIKAQQNQEIASFHAQARLIQAKAEAQVQRLKDDLELNRKERELSMDAIYHKQIKDIDINEFREIVNALSRDIYAQLESDKAWAKALEHTKMELPQILMTGGSGNSNGQNMLQDGAVSIALIEMLKNFVKPPKQINMSQQRESLPPSDDN